MTWNKLGAQRKTWIFLTAAGIAVLWLLWPSGMFRQRRLPSPPHARQAPKPPSKPHVKRPAAPAAAPARSSVVPAPVPPAPPAVAARPAPPAVAAPFNELLGQYVGREMLSEGRGTCVLRLELRRSNKAGEFSGFSNLVCAPLLAEVIAENRKSPRGRAVDARNKAANPTLATLSGTAVDGSIRMHAVKNFGVRDARNGCAVTTLNVTPGGTNTIDVDWQESLEPTGVCRGAQIQMKKTSR
jgi:hypothetical protein